GRTEVLGRLVRLHAGVGHRRERPGGGAGRSGGDEGADRLGQHCRHDGATSKETGTGQSGPPTGTKGVRTSCSYKFTVRGQNPFWAVPAHWPGWPSPPARQDDLGSAGPTRPWSARSTPSASRR